MLESVSAWLDLLEGWLATPTASRAIVAGLALSWAGTQFAKKHILPKSWDDDTHKRVTAMIAFLLGVVPTFYLWPVDGGLMAALIVGLASPSLYLLAVRTLYHSFPWLEPKISARPTKIVKTSEGYEERDITQPSSQDEKTVFKK